MIFFAFFCKKILSCQKKVVPLHRNSKRSYKTILHNQENKKFTIMIAYLSIKTSRVYKTYEEAKNDAKVHIAVYLNLSFNKAISIAEQIIDKNPKEYINIVFIHI